MKLTLSILVWNIIFLCSVDSSANNLIVKIPWTGEQSKDRPNHFPDLVLRLALDKTVDTHGEYTIQYVTSKYTSDRLRAMIIKNEGVDLMWSTVTSDRELKMQSIDYDLFRGLNGYRVLIVSKGNPKNINKNMSIDELKELKVGLGGQWSDTQIMSNNGFNVVTASAHESLFKMLAAGRFDFMTRGIHEVEYELDAYRNLSIELEPEIMLYYCHPVRFYMNRENGELYLRLIAGLSIARADGSIEALFNDFKSLKESYKLLNGSRRQLYHLNNSYADCVDSNF